MPHCILEIATTPSTVLCLDALSLGMRSPSSTTWQTQSDVLCCSLVEEETGLCSPGLRESCMNRSSLYHINIFMNSYWYIKQTY